MARRAVILKSGKERSLLARHPWIFSGAVDKYPDFTDGEILAVESQRGELLGHAYFNRACSLVGRMLSFGNVDPLRLLRDNILRSIELRQKLFDHKKTNAYRLINAEGDGLPGLIVDRYDDVLVLQSGTLGIDRLKALIVDELTRSVKPRSILERSTSSSRAHEGLQALEETLSGDAPTEATILENALAFEISFVDSQKTGFFLDQREVRSLTRELANGRRVLNCFGYTGAFSVYALSGGAAHVETVEISSRALDGAQRNSALNGFSAARSTFKQADVFNYLRSTTEFYDLIVLDPPAFTKSASAVAQAERGYREINRSAFARLAPGGILVTCSCSYFIDEPTFQKSIYRAALEAGRFVRVLSRHRQALDHPWSLYHREGEYLKSFVLMAC